MAALQFDQSVLARLIEEAAGPGARVGTVERIGDFNVARVSVVCDDDASPRNVIVKLRRVRSSGRDDLINIVREHAALQFMAAVDPGLVPAVLAADTGHGMLVLEDLAPLSALNGQLVNDGPRSVEGLRLFARTMARLHVRTIGTYQRFHRGLPAEVKDRVDVLGPWELHSDNRPDWVLPDVTGFTVPAGAARELRELQQLMIEPGPFTAFSNGDPGANNFLTDGRQGRITDWEGARFCPAPLDAACLWVPNSIWMTIAEPVALGLDVIYREALSEGVPEARTTAYEEMLAAGCIVRAADRLKRFRLLDGRPAGHESRAQMIFTLEAAARSVDHLKRFPALAIWAHDTSTYLRTRWPDADCEFPNAFTTRAAWTAQRQTGT